MTAKRKTRALVALGSLAAVAMLLSGCAAALMGGGTGAAAGTTAGTAGGQSAADSAKTAAVSSGTQTAVTEGAKAAIEDRSAADQASDLRIVAEINSDLLGESTGLFIDASADVWEQRVMLTGTVEKPEDKAKAEEIVAAIDGVKEIYNEIRVTSEGGGLSGLVDDTVITTKIDANLLTASDVNSLNYRWRSVDGTVYLLGRALGAAELDKVKALAADIDDVRQVISHVEVRPKDSG